MLWDRDQIDFLMFYNYSMGRNVWDIWVYLLYRYDGYSGRSNRLLMI